MQLSGKQKQVVSHLESHFQDVQIGEVGPAEMGRSAARELDRFLHDLHGEVEKLLPHSYLGTRWKSGGKGKIDLKVGHQLGESGTVVGHLPSGVL